MKRWLLFSALMGLVACSSPGTLTQPPIKRDYPDLGPAPELSGGTWLNTPVPLRLANLRGKVVLVDMWTFG